jgi:hypothetical protein
MKTTTFGDVLNQACELAMRTRDKLPPSEEISTQGFIATEFETLVNSQPWPELIPAVFNVAAANRQFSKNEGSVNPLAPEMGDILWLGTMNPEASPGWCRHGCAVGFSEGDGVVFVESDCASLWVEFMLPYPGVLFPDLTPGQMTLVNFLAQKCPLRFRNILAHRAAGHLLGSDANTAGAGVQYGLAEKVLAAQINRLPPAPWWRATARMRRPVERRHYGVVC